MRHPLLMLKYVQRRALLSVTLTLVKPPSQAVRKAGRPFGKFRVFGKKEKTSGSARMPYRSSRSLRDEGWCTRTYMQCTPNRPASALRDATPLVCWGQSWMWGNRLHRHAMPRRQVRRMARSAYQLPYLVIALAKNHQARSEHEVAGCELRKCDKDQQGTGAKLSRDAHRGRTHDCPSGISGTSRGTATTCKCDVTWA